MAEQSASGYGGGRMTPEQAAGVLLHEWESLRCEILERTTHMYMVIAAEAIVLGWFVANHDGWIWLVAPVVLVIVVSVYAFWLIRRDIKKAAMRLREIEVQVDYLTGWPFLLRWERVWGGDSTSYWDSHESRAHPRIVPDDAWDSELVFDSPRPNRA